MQQVLFETFSDWKCPTSLPDLSQAKEISIDTETCDPRLKTHGPGFIRRDGYVAGVSVATSDGFSGYFPIRHQSGGNLDGGVVASWLKETCAKDREYIFTNAQYDLGWLRTLGVEVRGTIRDISVAAALLDEEDRSGYSLDAISRRYTGVGKDESLLVEVAKNHGIDPKADLWMLHSKYVGPYATADAVRTKDSWKAIKLKIAEEKLNEILQLETEVTPILFEMFWRGTRVDLGFAESLNDRWRKEEIELERQTGVRVTDLWTPAAIAGFCDKRKIEYPRTKPTKNYPMGQASITAGFMEHSNNKELLLLRKFRAINRTRQTFLHDVILKGHINGRIHPQYIQLASDEGGTRTGRLSCKNPNAQQFPKRSRLFDAKTIRKVMIPEEGCEWAKFDFWSQEPTLQVHFALLTGLPKADFVRDQFAKRIKLYTIIEDATQGKCNYDDAKQVVLARSYGQQVKSMAEGMGISVDRAADILQEFDNAAPYIALLASNVEAKAKRTGYVRTVLGRKLRFKYYKPVGRKLKDDEKPLEKEQAMKEWPDGIELDGTYRALNKLIQGSAADQAKRALVEVNRALGLPMFPVHDELSKSVKSRNEALKMKEIMETCVPLLCPAQTDMDLGPTWV